MRRRDLAPERYSISYHVWAALGFMYTARFGVDMAVFTKKDWLLEIDSEPARGSIITHVLAYVVQQGRYLAGLEELRKHCYGVLTKEVVCGTELGWALSDCSREDLVMISKNGLCKDASLVADWRLEFDIGIDHILPKNIMSRSFGISVDRKCIEKLIHLYEIEATETLDKLSDSNSFSDMVYHRCTSPLYWGILEASRVDSMTLGDLLMWSVIPEHVPKCRGNSDTGYEWYVDTMAAEKADEFSEYLLINWEDYRDSVIETTNPFLASHILVSGRHPIRPDSYIVARWRLENGLFL